MALFEYISVVWSELFFSLGGFMWFAAPLQSEMASTFISPSAFCDSLLSFSCSAHVDDNLFLITDGLAPNQNVKPQKYGCVKIESGLGIQGVTMAQL